MLKRYYNRLLRREEGSTLIESAFVLPVLLLLMMGIVEYSLVMFGEAVLEGATYYAAREGSTDYVNNSNTASNPGGSGVCPNPVKGNSQSQAAFIYCIVGTRVGSLLTPANLQMNVVDYSAGYPSGVAYFNCNPTSATPTCIFGGPGDIVVYTVQYPWPIVTPFLSTLLGTNGVFTLQASAMIKNEPFPTGR